MLFLSTCAIHEVSDALENAGGVGNQEIFIDRGGPIAASILELVDSRSSRLVQ